MAHMLRKYASNRGSALFMVISTMTALFISCMAMYFSMVAARSSQDAIFNKMQANQSAMSVSDIVISALSDKNHPLYDAALNLKPGESITTDSNGFQSLDPNKATGIDQDQIGSYAVTITCIPDPKGDHVLDIMVVTSVNGNRQSIHRTWNMSNIPPDTPKTQGAGGDAELFAATGYVPNDAYILSGHFMTDVFYDTQFTYINTYTSIGSASENRLGRGLSTGGNLMLYPGAMSEFNGPASCFNETIKEVGPVTWAIRGDFYPYFGNDFAVRGGSKVLVGGDFIREGPESSFTLYNSGYTGDADLEDHIYIYVNGDFNYNGGYTKQNTWIFVNGKVSNLDKCDSGGRIFLTENATIDDATVGSYIKDHQEVWPMDHTHINAAGKEMTDAEIEQYHRENGLSYNEAMQLLGQKTATISYYKWDLSDEFKDAKKIDIRLNATNEDWVDDTTDTTYLKGESTYIISYDENTQSADLIKGVGKDNNVALYPGVVGNSFIINSVWTKEGADGVAGTIIIDTGDDPDNIITIQASDVSNDGSGIFSWFFDDIGPTDWSTWPPIHTEKFGTPAGQINNRTRLVLLRGRGTVLVDIPEGVTYQDASYSQTSHVSWFLAEGGKIKTRNVDGRNYLDFEFKADQPKGGETVKYIHTDCVPSKDGCTLTLSDSDATCVECGGKLTLVTCPVHNEVGKFCNICHPDKASKQWCVNHVDYPDFDDFYKTLSGAELEWATGKDGKVVYPTINFMLISCNESAEVLFSQNKDNSTISSNSFHGFVYAPYVSFLGSGGSIQGHTKICGGMTVSDYDFNSTHSYLGCYPDRMPNEIAGMEGGGSMAGGELTGASKQWKIEIGGYR